MNISKERSGVLYILVGPGGVGKNALLNAVLTEVDDLRQLPTATTRNIRPGEEEGREHQFVSKTEFKQMIDADALIEYQEVHPGKFYGVPKATVENGITEARDQIADVEVLGASIIREQYPQNSVMIFIAPPSIDALAARLRNRDASEIDIRDRLNRLPMEMRYAPLANYIVVNDVLDLAIREVVTIIRQAAGDDRQPLIELPVNVVTYYAQVAILYDGQVLVPANANLPTLRINAGQEPDVIALQHVRELIGSPAAVDYLSFDLPAGVPPIRCDYEPEKHIYTLHYRYVYSLDQRIDAPEGWVWQPYTPDLFEEVKA